MKNLWEVPRDIKQVFAILVLLLAIPLLSLAQEVKLEEVESIPQKLQTKSAVKLLRQTHACGEQGGSVAFEIVGKHGPYRYAWQHGPKSLELNKLNPGRYTLEICDRYGCVEIEEVEILSPSEAELSVHQSRNSKCQSVLELGVLSNGRILRESALLVDWQDNQDAGLNRVFDKTDSGEFCVSIGFKGAMSDQQCKPLQRCFQIESKIDCEEQSIASGAKSDGLNQDLEAQLPSPLSVYPNPFVSGLNLSLETKQAGRLTAQVFNSTGELLYQHRWDADRGQCQKQLLLPTELPTGIYLVQVIHADGTRQQTSVSKVQKY